MTKPIEKEEHTLVLTRLLDAPRAVVWRAWTDPAAVARWWGPSGFTNPVCGIDARPGGAIRILMRAPDGGEHPVTGVFREVAAPERLSFAIQALDARGETMIEAVVTVTFAERAGKTELKVEARAVAVAAEGVERIEGMDQGWAQTLDRLVEYVAAQRG